MTLYNCSSYLNAVNYSFGTTIPLGKLIVKNSNTLGVFGLTSATIVDMTNIVGKTEWWFRKLILKVSIIWNC
ncbi:hypothetical protein [Flavobacterium cellulosilyticum]|uniref:hypothetical protein n=1 Tax=Flavobacterium cellulosilyticum TaxID=2541731 RepID=UPI0014049F0B|nr:hypothetical protein [Flavobacterium cellulosilyticum]